MSKFEILGTIANESIEFDNAVLTSHFSYERIQRHKNIMAMIGDGKLVQSFIVDKDHPNGPEIHNIFDNGIILIQNLNTRRVITELIARPNQIRRYWTLAGNQFPSSLKYLTELAYEHERKGYNEIWNS